MWSRISLLWLLLEYIYFSNIISVDINNPSSKLILSQYYAIIAHSLYMFPIKCQKLLNIVFKKIFIYIYIENI